MSVNEERYIFIPDTDNEIQPISQKDRVKNMPLRPERVSISKPANENGRKSQSVKLSIINPLHCNVKRPVRVSLVDPMEQSGNNFQPQRLTLMRSNDINEKEGTVNHTLVQPMKKYVEQSMVQPIRQSVAQTMGQSMAHPLRQSFTQPMGQFMAQPMRQSNAQPMRQSNAQPMRHSTAQQMRQSITQPMGQSMAQPMRRSTNQPMEQSIAQPMRQSIAQQMRQSIVQPMGQSMAQPMRRSTAQPMEQSIAQPMRQSTAQSMRQSEALRQPLGNNIRFSTVTTPTVGENIHPMRVSVGRPLNQADGFPMTPQQPKVYAVTRTSKQKRPSVLKRLLARKKQEEDSDEEEVEFSKKTKVDRDVSVTPTRGRTTSILQQSVKSLTSKDETPIAWKNIRFSRETDVFSVDVKNKYQKPLSPGYVNMERGQPMLVSELLNPITSLFVSDLKNPVPKDPLNKPKEYNVWVKPRNSAAVVVQPTPKQRSQPVPKQASQPVSRQPPPKSATRVAHPSSTRKYHRYDYDDEDDDSSSSEDSIQYRNQRNRNYRTSHRVYAAEIPEVILPNAIDVTEENPSKENDEQHIDDLTAIQKSINVKNDVQIQKREIKDALNTFSHPTKTSIEYTNPEMKWRVVVKKQDSNN